MPETDLEGSEGKVPQLLGISGSVTRAVEDAVEAVRDVHTSDGLMYHEFVSMTALPSWVLTEVRSPVSAPSASDTHIPRDEASVRSGVIRVLVSYSSKSQACAIMAEAAGG